METCSLHMSHQPHVPRRDAERVCEGVCREGREGRGKGGRAEGEMKRVLEERNKKRRMEGKRGQNEKKERRKRGYLSVQVKLVLFNALTHKPERQENNND